MGEWKAIMAYALLILLMPAPGLDLSAPNQRNMQRQDLITIIVSI
jgi:hypothetical protein